MKKTHALSKRSTDFEEGALNNQESPQEVKNPNKEDLRRYKRENRYMATINLAKEEGIIFYPFLQLFY